MDNVGSISSQSDWVKVYFESQTDNLLINQVWGMRERWESRITPKAFDLCYGHVIRPFKEHLKWSSLRKTTGALKSCFRTCSFYDAILDVKKADRYKI